MTLTLYTLHVLVVANDSPLLTEDQLTLLGWRTSWWRWSWRRSGARLVGRGPLEAVSSWLSRRAAAAVVRR